MIQDYVCVDLETTGLDPKTDKIIEIGAVRIKNGEIAERFQSFVNPGRMLNEKVKELTGISDDDLYDAPSIEEVLPKFLEFAKEDCLLGHSILFDYSFLKKAVVNLDKKNAYERMGIDTLKIARKHLASLESRRLSYLCEYYHIEQNAHRALEDAVATHKLYQKLLEDFKDVDEKDFEPQKLIYNVKRETPITNAQKERLSKLITLHKIDYLYDLNTLTRNEASRITDQILSTYGR
ncbi:MAG: 3'-5' exonuclease [Lachnospiraceae bacterium]|nr:3'-5' exonuclease [Lachnospiraceae bacterium]